LNAGRRANVKGRSKGKPGHVRFQKWKTADGSSRPESLSQTATSFVESLKINSITEKALRHRRVRLSAGMFTASVLPI